MSKKMLIKTIVLAIVYLFATTLLIAPYLSSFVYIQYLNHNFSQELVFDFSSWKVFIDAYLNENLIGNSDQLKAITFGSYAFLGAYAIPFVLGAIIGMIVLIKGNKLSVHGQGRLANDRDLAKSGFFPTLKEEENSKYPAILIGKAIKGRFKNKFIKYMGQQFLMLYAPTRSGKGVGIVIPNCLYYRDSLVVLDIKLENFRFTGGHREKNLGQDVYLFCPEGWEEVVGSDIRKTHRYNPLVYVSRDHDKRITDISKISSILFPKTGGENDMWTDLSKNLFDALALYLLDCETEKDSSGKPLYKTTLSQIYRLSIPTDGRSLSKFLTDEIEQRNTKQNIQDWYDYANNSGSRPTVNILDDATVRLIRQFTNLPEKQQQSIMLQFNAEMSMFANPVTASATDDNDFDFRDIRRKKTTIYYGLSPDGIDVYKKLTNLFFSQLIGQNVGLNMMPQNDPTLKYQCLLMLDEFTSMGKVSIIQESVAFTAGYNMRYVFILQNREQLEDNKAYGKEGAQTLISNCAVELMYPPRVVNETVNQVSETIGYYDYETKTVSKTKGHNNNSTTYGKQLNKRAVLLPQEIVELRDITDKDSDISLREIVLSEKTRAFIADKIIYFKEPYFLERQKFSLENIPEIPVLSLEENKLSKAILKGA